MVNGERDDTARGGGTGGAAEVAGSMGETWRRSSVAGFADGAIIFSSRAGGGGVGAPPVIVGSINGRAAGDAAGCVKSEAAGGSSGGTVAGSLPRASSVAAGVGVVVAGSLSPSVMKRPSFFRLQKSPMRWMNTL